MMISSIQELFPVALSLFAILPAACAQLVVTTVVDEDDGDPFPGNGTGTSLREAVNYANANDTITFANALSGATISVTVSHLSVTKSLTIDASALAEGVTIDGHAQNRLFTCGSQSTCNFIGLTLTGGRTAGDGGAILNNGVLTLHECTLRGNTANEGGAAFNFGNLTLNNCTVVGNHARFGGGFEEDGGTLTLNNTTVTGNVASIEGGGIINFFSVTLNNSTVVANSAGNDEEGGWGGGISNCDTLRLNNSIVAGNMGRLRANVGGTIDSSTGANLTSGDPMLAPLGDYGGPTMTMPPLPGSPAIDPVDGISSLTTDQRGFPRSVDGDEDQSALPDIGAAEFNPTADLPAFWPLDWDGDGVSFGIEHAIGTDPRFSDSGSVQNFTIIGNGAGEIELNFGLNLAASGHTAWIVQHSPDLSPGSFVEIFRLHGPTMEETRGAGIESALHPPSEPNTIVITDRTPSVPRAFYILGAESVPAGP